MKPLNIRANGGKTPKTTPGQQCPRQVPSRPLQHFFSPSPAIEKKFAESAFFHIKIKNLSWNRSSANAPHREKIRWVSIFSYKNQKLAKNYSTMSLAKHAWNRSIYEPSGQNTKTFLQPNAAPRYRENIRWVSIFSYKTLSWNRWIHEPRYRKKFLQKKNLSVGNNAPCLHAHMQHFFSPSPAIEKKFAESAFFHTKIKNLSWNCWIYEPMGAKHQKLLLGEKIRKSASLGKCLHAHMQHFFSRSPAIEKTFAESAFFHTKIKNLSWNRWIYEPMGAKHQKLLLGNNAPGKCLHAHMQHFFSPSPAIEKKFAESAFFHTKIKNLSWNRWIYEPMGANTKNYSWATMPLASAFTPTCNISSAVAPLSRKNSLSQHFFYKNQKLVMKPLNLRANGGKHQKLLLGNNAPGKCLHAHMQHFFSRSPAIEKKFAESAFFHTKIKNLSWNRWIYEPMGAKHQKLLLGNNAPGKCLHAHMQHFFSPSPAIEKKFAESAFFHTKIKNLSWNRWIYEPMGENTKNYSWATMPWQVPSRPHATFLQP